MTKKVRITLVIGGLSFLSHLLWGEFANLCTPFLSLGAGLMAGLLAVYKPYIPGETEASQQKGLQDGLLVGSAVGLFTLLGQWTGTILSILFPTFAIQPPFAWVFNGNTQAAELAAAFLIALVVMLIWNGFNLMLTIGSGAGGGYLGIRLYQGQMTKSWNRQPKIIHYKRFAQGSNKPFTWYFEGTSTLELNSLEEICQWLRACEYVRDPDLFIERDFWQHPVTFEQLRKGDCEDHALWAWRKLAQLNIPAEFVVGRHVINGTTTGHAWVTFELDGQHFVMETTNKIQEIIIPLAEAKATYFPDHGVDSSFKTYRYR